MSSTLSYPILAIALVFSVWALIRRFAFRATKEAEKLPNIESELNRLRKTQGFLDSLIENIPDMIFVKEAQNLSFVSFNRAGENLIGRSRHELIGKNDFDFFPPEQAAHFTSVDREVFKLGQLVDIAEEDISTPRGIRYLHTKKIPIYGEDGAPLFLLGISEDITEKKLSKEREEDLGRARLELDLADRVSARLALVAEISESFNSTLCAHQTLENLSEAMVRKTADVAVSYLFPTETCADFAVVATSAPFGGSEVSRLERVHALKPTTKLLEQLAAQQEQLLFHREFSPLALESLFTGITHLALPFSEYAKYTAILAPLRRSENLMGCVLLISRNPQRLLTEYDTSFIERITAGAELSIENARLFQQAQEANRAKSSFLSTMSHELRSPLSAILGFAEIALENKDEPREHLLAIERNGRHLLRLVDEILDLAKVESDRMTFEMIPFELDQLIDECIAIMKARADQKGLSILRKQTIALPKTVISDPLRLKQVLMNIIGNAIKFTDSGEITVETVFSREKEDSGHLYIRVVDTGIGIGRVEASQLFQKFSQADNSISRRFGGSGLGLYLSRKIAVGLGGNVQLIRSELNKGSTFEISIAIHLPATTKAPIPLVRKPPRVQSSSLSGKRVLVVEDSTDNQTLIRYFLSPTGIGIVLANDGREGIESSQKEAFDLILMDLEMPVLDGLTAVKRIREIGIKIPIIALTAHAMKGDREKCFAAGFTDYLTKPIDRNQLLATLNRYLKPSESVHEMRI